MFSLIKFLHRKPRPKKRVFTTEQKLHILKTISISNVELEKVSQTRWRMSMRVASFDDPYSRRHTVYGPTAGNCIEDMYREVFGD